MRATIQYFEGASYIGSRECEFDWHPEDIIAWSRHWSNTAYWCQDCGEIWARAVTQALVPLPQDWALVHNRCPKHGAGLLLLWTDLDEADEDLTRREFLATIEGVSHEHSRKYFPACP